MHRPELSMIYRKAIISFSTLSLPARDMKTGDNNVACDRNKNHVKSQARRMQQSSGSRAIWLGWVRWST
ncbi:hypothetical protein BP00DRAFT_424617 [Aspergillus indologenus CBS 114.80]|uniref:Uncharacterized protein n=1 Tax=Aspergillus indologenus CBS 114.80 TaxID=1450541 RepID=A0A2V5I9S9_9EURO|nr:hypothetical protein BP00DRAFT_424617 [Aspergillus indologenus CBS 114.80]